MLMRRLKLKSKKPPFLPSHVGSVEGFTSGLHAGNKKIQQQAHGG
jgi:hypothetical protein